MEANQQQSHGADDICEGLGDLRIKFSGNEMAQNLALRRSFPALLSQRAIQRMATYQGGNWTESHWVNGLSGAIVLLRHLYSMIAMRYRGDETTSDMETMEKMRQEEKENYLLRIVWAYADNRPDFDITGKVRGHILKHHDTDEVPSIFNLLENPSMWNTIWNRPPLRLYHRVVLGRRRGERDWVQHALGDMVGWAEEGLILWDGDGSLGEWISQRFGITFYEKQMCDFRHAFGDPAIIRVLYRHRSNVPAKRYHDLKQIKFDPRRPRQKVDDDGKMTLVEEADSEERVVYNLVAVVKCLDPQSSSNNEDKDDRIRLYERHGQAIMLPMSCNKFTGIQWEIGSGSYPLPDYLLYYAQTPPVDARGGHGEEIAPKPEGLKALIEEMKVSRIPTNSRGGYGKH